MSKEIIEEIKRTEKTARDEIQKTQQECERMIKAEKERLADEKKELQKRLKREHNERILRCELVGQKAREEAEKEIEKSADDARKKYESLSGKAVLAAVNVLLGR